MKKIINKPETVVQEMCHGMVLAHPRLRLNAKYKVLYKKDLSPEKVQLLSGSGCGRCGTNQKHKGKNGACGHGGGKKHWLPRRRRLCTGRYFHGYCRHNARCRLMQSCICSC